MQNYGFHGNQTKTTSSSHKLVGRFSNNYVSWVTLYSRNIQICSSRVDWLKNMATSGQGCFALYDFNENFKNLLLGLRKYVAAFQIILTEMFLG